MNLNKKNTIGIWGYGIVGKSITNYLHGLGYIVSVMDRRTLQKEELAHLQQKKINFYNETDKKPFLNFHDYLFLSPGVNIGIRYATHKQKLLSEIDIFTSIFNKKIIAVTGSVGKTSVTHLLSTLLLLSGIKSVTGGNIGIPTFDLLQHKDIVDWALLELSSFQLQQCTTFAPALALWTNFYPNHLDHHSSLDDYFMAKYAIFAKQNSNQKSVANVLLREKILAVNPQKICSYFSGKKPTQQFFTQLHPQENVYYNDNNTIFYYAHNIHTPLLVINQELSNLSFIENIVLLSAACHLLGIDQKNLLLLANNTALPAHRLEKISSPSSLSFYNDSKSTTTESTLAAVEKLSLLNKPIHLFLGGKSKGVNREPFIQRLKPFVSSIYCFGHEAEQLHNFCMNNCISSEYFSTLELALSACINKMDIHAADDSILFSPAGSSYDLYNNYQERGEHFRCLVKTIK